MRYQVGNFEVDDREFRLSDDGMPVAVEPKALRVLLYLIDNRNRLVRKEEVLNAVWPDAVVTENALSRAIALLRKALNDDSRVPKFIETVPTAGYRFIAAVTALEENASLESVSGKGQAAALVAIRSRRFSFWIAATILLLAAVTGIFLYRRRGRNVLTERDTVVLAEFENSTGDPVFDGTLRQGMTVQLEQSPFLTLITDERIRDTLQLMRQPPGMRLTSAVAREVCLRTSSTAVLDGSIAPLGTEYVLSLTAKDCQTGKLLAQEQVQAARKEGVLDALDRIASRFRSRVGESLTTVQKYDTPLAEATTSSLEALRAFSLGQRERLAGHETASLAFLVRAVELDPNFAEAYKVMSTVYNNHHQPQKGRESIEKAYELRERVSDRERFSIERSYYLYATGEWDKAVPLLESQKQIYPRDPDVHHALGVFYRRLGDSQRALEESLEAMRLAPNRTANYQNLAADYVNLNRLKEAGAVYKEAEARHLPYDGRLKSRYLLAFLEDDTVHMAQLALSAQGKLSEEDPMLAAQGDTEAWYGKLRNARELTRRAAESALAHDANETAAAYEEEMAIFEADVGEGKQSRSDALAAMKLARNRDTEKMAALALARSGDTAAAERLASELDKAFPSDTLIQRYWLPVIRAAIALKHANPNQALELLQRTSNTELSLPALHPVRLRGEAYLMLHDGVHAATEFQKYIDHCGLVRNLPWGPLGRLGLARAYVQENDVPKAKAAYEEFLRIWKDADTETPVLKEAKAEYAEL